MTSSEETRDKIIGILEENKVSFKHVTHEHVVTSEQAAKIRGMDPHTGAKALILEARDSKDNKHYIQAVLNGNRRMNYKALKEITGFKKLALAPPERVLELTGLTVGSIPPFGNLWNMKVYVDENLTKNETIAFSVATHTDSIIMLLKDYLKIVPHQIAKFSE
jgi:Ala-tRNA(Pro) deacylase